MRRPGSGFEGGGASRRGRGERRRKRGLGTRAAEGGVQVTPPPKVGAGGGGDVGYWPRGREADPGHAPSPGPQRAPPEVELAWALSSPRRQVTDAGVWAAGALGFRSL